jgi:hypothetical protein
MSLPRSSRGSEGDVLDPGECRRFADQCEAMSKVARHEENRERLLDMAAAWRRLADMAGPEHKAS